MVAQSAEHLICDQEIMGLILHSNLGQVIQTLLCASASLQYNVVPARGQ